MLKKIIVPLFPGLFSGLAVFTYLGFTNASSALDPLLILVAGLGACGGVICNRILFSADK